VGQLGKREAREKEEKKKKKKKAHLRSTVSACLTGQLQRSRQLETELDLGAHERRACALLEAWRYAEIRQEHGT